jgi:hypothetical protein
MDDWLIGGGIAVAAILGLAALTAWAFKKAIERAEQERGRTVREVVRELEERKQLPPGSE